VGIWFSSEENESVHCPSSYKDELNPGARNDAEIWTLEGNTSITL